MASSLCLFWRVYFQPPSTFRTTLQKPGTVNMPNPEKQGGGSKTDAIFGHCWMDPKMASTLIEKQVKTRSIFGPLLLWPWSSSGDSGASEESSWAFKSCIAQPWTPETSKNYRLFKVFANAGFDTLSFLTTFLGASRPFLG